MTGFLRSRVRAAKASDGFTLIEMLVAISLGIVVLVGATTIMLTTQRLARGSGVRNANTLDAAIAVQTIDKYLSSATAICALGTTVENSCTQMVSASDKQRGEIVAGSNYDDLTFYTDFDDADVLSAAAVANGVGPITAATPTGPVGSIRVPYKVHVYVVTSGVHTGDLRADLYAGSGTSTACCTWPALPTRSQLLAQKVKFVAPTGSTPGVPFSYASNPLGIPSSPVGAVAPVTGKVGSTIDEVDLDVVVNRQGNPVVPATEIKDSVLLPNRFPDQAEWKTFP